MTQARIGVSKKLHFQGWKVHAVNVCGLQRRKVFFAVVRCRSAEAASRSKINIGALPRSQKTSELRRLLRLAAPEKWTLAGAILLLIVSSTVTMAVPFCLGKIIDIIYTTDERKTRENLTKLSLALLGVFIVGGICNFGRVYLMSTTGHRITQALRRKSYAAILSQETGMFDRVSTGELVGRLTGN